MWLDFDRPDGSWNEWDCSYATGYSGICKKSFRRAGQTTQSAQTATPTPSTTHVAKRCCVSSGCNGYRCLASERCIPDDLNCWTKSCPTSGPGWCLPAI